MQPRYIMIGGFLGAGKTTAILRLGRMLSQRGLRVGLITNDQSVGLVDTAMARSSGFAVEEITGGCFCCKFNSLVEAADRLSKDARPDVFLAEPVGSCTDLVATVSYPLRRMYGEQYAIAPLSVVVDPLRAERILGLETGKAFSKKVIYIYEKQLEEAELIVVNKCDLLSAERLERLEEKLRSRFPRSDVMRASARDGIGMGEWLARVVGSAGGTAGLSSSAEAMELDYDLYAEGEALLGWLNATLRLSADEPFDANAAIECLARDLQGRLEAQGAEVAHLKMTFMTDDDAYDIAVVNLVRSGGDPEFAHRLHEPAQTGALILNLRAEADPQILRDAAAGALQGLPQTTKLTVEIEHLECFRPARPTPTHRIARA